MMQECPMSIVMLLPGAECGHTGPEPLGLKLTRCKRQSCAGASQVKLNKVEWQARRRGRSGEAEKTRAAKQSRSHSGEVAAMRMAKLDRSRLGEVNAVRVAKQGMSCSGEQSI
ncbi:hypothetical protein NDU88_004094 [Pleurodeles waltl]|uniref:Uncharacterized protein n=1 Tax=Pleurodeles waltl TaxID=8319 RepID=A0AAV7UEL7_PLEWA|nr:hypothetical protein NDU88_004094 [Pleurodeles waltl]